jgi:hypothetical protein
MTHSRARELLRNRVIALENEVIALLAKAPDRQLDLVREMAVYIAPRPGFTQHPLTVHAAAEMIHLVERSSFPGCDAFMNGCQASSPRAMSPMWPGRGLR